MFFELYLRTVVSKLIFFFSQRTWTSILFQKIYRLDVNTRSVVASVTFDGEHSLVELTKNVQLTNF